MQTTKETFLTYLYELVQQGKCTKLTLSRYFGKEPLVNCYIKPVLIKGKELFSINYRNKTNDIFNNVDAVELIELLSSLLDSSAFREANLQTVSTQETIRISKKGKWDHSINQKEQMREVEEKQLSHNREKKRVLANTRVPWMHLLGLTNSSGEVYKNAQDKYRQINHYIELLKPELSALAQKKQLRIYDMGAGKGYLTFALYQYLTENEEFNATEISITGVEYRLDLVVSDNEIAKQCGYDSLRFVQGEIGSVDTSDADVIIALHACDTATDDAIFKGLSSHARLIVTAPCCHKQVRKELEKTKADIGVLPIFNYGIHIEQTAELLTDSIRALVLESEGYSVKVMPFVETVHTPKNTMILASKREHSDIRTLKEKAIAQIEALKKTFGLRSHYLQELMNSRSV